MTTEEFDQQVRSAFGFLESEFGFAFGRYAVPTSFDNASVDYRSRTLAVTVARERGQCFINVGHAAYARFDLELICRALGDQAGQAIAGQQRPSLPDLAIVLRRHLPELAHLFSASERAATEHRLERAGEERANELFGRIENRRAAT